MRWNPLSIGDTVDVIAPASHAPLDKLQAGVRWLESLGLCPNVPQEIITPDIFFSAPLKLQMEHLKAALYSEAKAIWCLRGGYGSMRLIPHLEKMRPPKKPKLFIGFSDITALHLFFNQRWNWPTIHGRTISQLSLSESKTPDREEMKKLIFGELPEKTFRKLRPLNLAAQKEKIIEGKIVGGNLRIIQTSLGTTWEIDTKNKILFIEDIGERGYSVDRMLEQLHQAKLIDKKLKALVIGDFTGGDEADGSNLIQEALERFASRVPYPVIQGLPVGHDPHLNFPLPFNTRCQIELGKKINLTCDFGVKI
jgi:muramoyltetrapeptide carboxypeptidase